MSYELAPVGDNPGLFYIGWTRPFADDDFRQLRRFMLCWRVVDLDKNGTPDLEEGWRITSRGLEEAGLLGYQIFIDGTEAPVIRSDFRGEVMYLIDTRRAFHLDQEMGQQAGQEEDPQPPLTRREVDCSLVPILIKFLRPEIAFLGADLQLYGPFREG